MIPTVPGVPSWGTVLIAFTLTAIGFALDAGSGGKELTLAFAGAYALGCVAAVVAVRQNAVFTAVIQPPLILFVTVPGAYFLFHSDSIEGLKDLLINCGYPLIERFPLMFFTSALVLLVGLVRWYMGMSQRRTAPSEANASDGPLTAMTNKISGLLTRDGENEDATDAPATRRTKQHSVDRAARTRKTAAATARTRGDRPTKRTQPSRSRHTRPPETEVIEPVVERPRRPSPARRSADPTVPPAEPRRRPRAASTRDPREPREPRRQPPSERRSPYQRPDRHSRFDGFEPFEPPDTNGTNGTRRTNGTNGTSSNGTHHPISRVRYRGSDDDADPRPQYRKQPRPAKHQADAWEYDV